MKLKTLFLAASLTILSACVYADKQTHERIEQLHASTQATPVTAVSQDKTLANSASLIAENRAPSEVKPHSSTRLPEIKSIAPEVSFSKASIIIANILTRFEYDKKPLDLAMANRIFDEYFKKLDPQKMYFLESDIEQFRQYQPLFSEMILKGSLNIPFDIFRLYRQRVEERYDYVLKELERPFDFEVDESFSIERKKMDRATTVEQVNDVWRRRLKNDFLRLKLAGTDETKIRDTLRKRYVNNRNQILRMNSEEVAELFLNAYSDSTDPHTTYYSPTSAKNFDVQLSLSVEGIGAVLQKRDEYGQIREVVAGGPAARSGQLHPGDRIVAVGQGESGPMEDVVDWRLDDIVKKIRGKRGSVVRVEVIPAEGGLDGEHRTIRLVREKVMMEDQAARSKVLDTTVNGVTKKIGLITVPSFYEDFDARINGDSGYKNVTADVRKILETYAKEGVDAVVLDMRDNGGGSLNQAANLSGLFIGNQKSVVQVRTAEGRVSNVRSSGIEQVWDKPVVVIVNRISASAAEIFAAAMQDYNRGVVVGDPTWGKGTVQTFRALNEFLRNPENEDLGSLKWTIQKFFRVNGSSTQVKGVTPDIIFPSMFDPKELGESSYENVMPWSQIQAAEYEKFSSLDKTIAQLQQQHEERTATSGSWKLMLDETKYALGLSQRKTYSLNLNTRQAEREQMSETYKEFAERRKQLGEGDVATFKLDDGLAMGEGNLKQELEDEKKRKDNIDAIARESANIAADLVQVQAP
ncbi:MAG: carboxy terminal-processing peptidase [Pelistega sp.]|nr:carboxy terminal-processing peptidase [Pelistega sp.]